MIVNELPPKTEAHYCEEYLATWAAWKNDARIEILRAGSVCENYTSLDHDRGRAYAKLDIWIAQNTDAAIQDMGERNPAQKAALYYAYDVSAVWRFPRHNLAELIEGAKRGVIAGLKRRGVWFGD